MSSPERESEGIDDTRENEDEDENVDRAINFLDLERKLLHATSSFLSDVASDPDLEESKDEEEKEEATKVPDKIDPLAPISSNVRTTTTTVDSLLDQETQSLSEDSHHGPVMPCLQAERVPFQFEKEFPPSQFFVPGDLLLVLNRPTGRRLALGLSDNVVLHVEPYCPFGSSSSSSSSVNQTQQWVTRISPFYQFSQQYTGLPAGFHVMNPSRFPWLQQAQQRRFLRRVASPEALEQIYLRFNHRERPFVFSWPGEANPSMALMHFIFFEQWPTIPPFPSSCPPLSSEHQSYVPPASSLSNSGTSSTLSAFSNFASSFSSSSSSAAPSPVSLPPATSPPPSSGWTPWLSLGAGALGMAVSGPLVAASAVLVTYLYTSSSSPSPTVESSPEKRDRSTDTK